MRNPNLTRHAEVRLSERCKISPENLKRLLDNGLTVPVATQKCGRHANRPLSKFIDTMQVTSFDSVVGAQSPMKTSLQPGPYLSVQFSPLFSMMEDWRTFEETGSMKTENQKLSKILSDTAFTGSAPSRGINRARDYQPIGPATPVVRRR